MPRRARRTLLLAALVAGASLAGVRCACSDGAGSGGGDGGGGTQPPPEPTCAIDLTPYLAAEGEGAAVARRIADDADLVGGQASSGRAGDFLLRNDKVRFVVQGSDRSIGAQPYGGNLIDADVVRPDGEAGQDVMGELAPFYNFGRTPDPENEGDVFVYRDGSDGGAAVVVANGRDTVNDFLFVKGLIGQVVAGAQLSIDSERDLPLSISNYYVLVPGSTRVRYVTALCNTGSAAEVVSIGDLVDSGGKVQQFNPRSNVGGFGYQFLPTDFPFIAWIGEGSAYALVPKDGSQTNQAITVSGVTGTLFGGEDLFDFLGDPPDPRAPFAGSVTIPAGGMVSYERSVYVGRTLSDLTDAIYARRGPSGRISGTVTAGGQPAAGAHVAAMPQGGAPRPFADTVFVTDAEGRFEGVLPVGDYKLSADLPGRLGPEVDATIAEGGEATADLTVPPAGLLRVEIEDLAGNPMPGRVHVLCDPCSTPRSTELKHRDVVFDEYGDGVLAVRHVGLDGVATFEVPQGDYQVLVSRGLEYGTFPPDFHVTRQGQAVTVTTGETSTVTAPLARVVDTVGWISADFHVHAINSPDSPVPNQERVVTFLGEQVEVLVGTDHDFVTDFAPVIEQLGAGQHVASVVGDEITTFNFGHINAFPLEVDAAARNGGAIDWAGGRGATLPPAELFAAARARGAQVVQLNHPRGALGHFDALKLDTATGATHADPVSFRIAANGEDPAVDSKLFSHEFTAMELLNGYDRRGFETLLNDWFTFMSRGFVVTGTAVSDTHTWVSSTAGSPRSWVKVADDAPASLDPSELAASVNAHAVVGSTGPFLSVTATSGASSAGIGETLATGGAGNEVALRVVVQSPAWIEWNRVEVFSYREGRESTNGAGNSSFPDDGVATLADGSPARVVVDPADGALLEDGAEGGAAHPRRVLDHTFTFAPEADTFYVVVVRALTDAGEPEARSLFPIAMAGGNGAMALAFANPVLVDVDGNGYDAFPLRRLGRPGRQPPAKPLLEVKGKPTLEHLERFLELVDAH